MASDKDLQAARPSSQHRLFLSSTPSSTLPIRHSTSRHHSHSVSLGTINPTHRVTRRKSMTSSAANNVAAIAAVIKGADETSSGVSIPSHRRSLNSRTSGTMRGLESTSGGRSGGSMGDTYAVGSVPGHDHSLMNDAGLVNHGLAIDDVLLGVELNGSLSKGRSRRASEGAHIARSEGKRASGELRCEKCGKGYKHSSCLTKHLWEHTPEWSYTSKLLISKHQQVQLLEAASVLVTMNQDPLNPSDSTKNTDSDQSSASPAASGYSEPHDDYSSSAESTPPPMIDLVSNPDGLSSGNPKRYSSNSSGFSRSYQSAPPISLVAGTQSTGTLFGHHRKSSHQGRPSASGIGSLSHLNVDEDEAGLAAAVESLCSFGTPRTGPVHLPLDIPPVPPLPARFAGQSVNRSSGSMIPSTVYQNSAVPPSLSHLLSEDHSMAVDETHLASTDDEYDDDYDQRSVSHSRSDEDDDGVFGRMEE